MEFKTVNTYQRLSVPSNVIHTIFVLIIILLLSPYVGGIDFGFFKVPAFPPEIELLFKWVAPFLFVVFLMLFIPIWKSDSVRIEEQEEQPETP